MDEKILIVGGGVAGLYVKNRLESLGYAPILTEKSESIRAEGAGILLGPNVLKLFRASGHEAEILKYSTRIDMIRLLDYKARSLGVSDLVRVRKKSSYEAVAIHRKALHEILLQSVEPSSIKLSSKLTNLHETPKGYEAEFENGERETYDFVIGADGIHSVVRKALFGDDGLRDAHQSCCRFVCEAPKELDMHSACEMWGEGKRVGIFPIGEGKVYCFLLADAEPKHKSMDLKAVLNLFKEFEGDWQKIVRFIPNDTELLFNPIADLAKIRLSKGQAVLIGDAGHSTTPNLGQGAAIGLESAYEFAELVKTYGLKRAMEFYESKRYNRVDFIRERSRAIGKIAHLKSPFARAIRNTILRFTPQAVGQKEFEKAFWGN